MRLICFFCRLAPPRPPANVTALEPNTTSTSITLEWDPPKGPIPGILRGYRIFYARAPDVINTTTYTTVDNETIEYKIAKDNTLINVTINDTGLTEYVVTGLEPYTWYFLWVTAFTTADSPNSHAVSWQTDEDGKSLNNLQLLLFWHFFIQPRSQGPPSLLPALEVGERETLETRLFLTEKGFVACSVKVELINTDTKGTEKSVRIWRCPHYSGRVDVSFGNLLTRWAVRKDRFDGTSFLIVIFRI